MNSDNKNPPKNQNNTQYSSYNPWNLLFTPRTRTESENSGSSTSSQNYQTGGVLSRTIAVSRARSRDRDSDSF